MSQVSKDLGVADSSLSRGCQEYGQQGERAFVGSGHQQPEEEELRRLRRENEVLRQERDILYQRGTITSTTRNMLQSGMKMKTDIQLDVSGSV